MGSGQFASYPYNFYKQMLGELANGLSTCHLQSVDPVRLKESRAFAFLFLIKWAKSRPQLLNRRNGE